MKYEIQIDCTAVCTFRIDAENEDELDEKIEELIASDDFFVKYRENCDFFDPEKSYMEVIK